MSTTLLIGRRPMMEGIFNRNRQLDDRFGTGE